MYKNGLIYLGVILIGLLAYRFFTNPYNLNSHSFKKLYKSGDVADKNLYPIQCDAEAKSNLNFPIGEVDKAIVCRGFFLFDHKVDKENTNRIIKILNDTANYIWGEVGTFLPREKIVFYDKENNPLGITEIDINGSSTYSYPYLKKMKWGSLTVEAGRQLQKLMEKE